MSAIFTRRWNDLIGAFWTSLGGMLCIHGGSWQKFNRGGDTGGMTGQEDSTNTQPVKPSDNFDVTSLEAYSQLFSTDEDGETARSGYAGGASSDEVMAANRRSDILASMHGAMGLRYCSRIRAAAAATSRMRGLARYDMTNIAEDILNVGTPGITE